MSRQSLEIRPQHVEETLNNWREGCIAHPSLLSLRCLDSAESVLDRDYLLHATLTNIANMNLGRLRVRRKIPHNPYMQYTYEGIVLEAIEMDAKQPLAELMSWSACYFSLMIPVTISRKLMAHRLRMDCGLFDIFVIDGLKRLTCELLLQEMVVREEDQIS